MKLIDRLEYATELCCGKRVLDIGGVGMSPDGTSAFHAEQQRLRDAAREYTSMDKNSLADIMVDLNKGMPPITETYDVVLCMETLEHLKSPGLVTEYIIEHVLRGAEAFVTLPRQSMFIAFLENYGIPGMWDPCDHLCGFNLYHFRRFCAHHLLATYEDKLNLTYFKCIGRYSKVWPIAYALTLFRGFSFGVHVRPHRSLPS